MTWHLGTLLGSIHRHRFGQYHQIDSFLDLKSEHCTVCGWNYYRKSRSYDEAHGRAC